MAVHGCTRLLALVTTLACCLGLSAAAAVASIPSGTYDVTLGDGTIDIGNGLLPALPVHSGTSFPVGVGSHQLTAPIGLTFISTPISQTSSAYAFTGTANVTVLGASAKLDPASGEVTVDGSFYATLTGTGSVVVAGTTFPISGSCAFGSSTDPINVHLSSAQGSPWDPATGAMSLVDKTFGFAYSCPGLFGTAMSLLVGNTGVGDNIATITGTLIRRPDPVNTTPPVTTQSTPAAGGGSTAPVSTTGAPPAAVKTCVVPKLVGKTLKQAKRALTRAGCKVGKTTKAKSKKRKGRIVKQRYKAGTKLPAGTKIPIAISKGKKKARSRH